MRDTIVVEEPATQDFTVDILEGSVSKNSIPIALGTRERAAVMAMALHPVPLSRQRLCDLIYADLPEGGAPENVKVYVHRVRRRTAWDFIRHSDGSYALGRDVRIRTTTFRDVDRECQQLSTLGILDLERLRLQARQLRTLVPNSLLAYDWFAGVSLAHQRAGRQLALNLAGEMVRRSNHLEAIQIATELTFEDPCDEEAWEAVIRCQVLLGQRSAAAHSYRFLTASLERDLGVKPSFDGLGLILR